MICFAPPGTLTTSMVPEGIDEAFALITARGKSATLCQRFKRRIRQCEATELRISTRVARLNHTKLTEKCQRRTNHWTTSSKKTTLRIVPLSVRAHVNFQV